jgi:hypothetical protein
MSDPQYQVEKENLTKERDMIIEMAVTKHNNDIRIAEGRKLAAYKQSQDRYDNVMEVMNEKLVRETGTFDHDLTTAWLYHESKRSDLKIVNGCLKSLSEERNNADSICNNELEAAAFKHDLAITKAQHFHDTQQITLKKKIKKKT